MSAEILKRAFDSTRAVLAQASGQHFELPTPCASWTVRDLVNHIVGGPTYFAVTAETGISPEPSELDHTEGDFVAQYRAAAERAVAAFSAEGAMDKILKLPFGDLPASIFVWIAANDAFTHGWDLAKALGLSTDLDPTLADQLREAAKVIPDEMRGPDGVAPFGPVVEAPESATAADRLAAFMGRQL